MVTVEPKHVPTPPPLAFVCHPFHRGGVTRWMVDMAIAWRRAGGQCWFVAPTPSPNIAMRTDRPPVLELIADVDPIHRVELVTWVATTDFELGTEAHRAFVYAQQVVASLPVGVPLLVSDDAAVWQGCSLVAERNPLIGVLHADEEKYYDLVGSHAPHVAALVCVSARIATELCRLTVPASVLVARIPCGVPLRNTAEPDNEQARSELRLVWIGRMEEAQKRVSDLPWIALALRDNGASFHLALVGDGPDASSLRASVEQMGLDSSVTFCGWRTSAEIRDILDQSDILILPSNFEGMSVSVMEALGAGCAVVSSRTSGVEDYDHLALASGCLWTYPVGDIAAAVSRIASAAAVPRKVRAECARRLAEEEFTIKRCVARYVELLGRLPARDHAAPALSTVRAGLEAVWSHPISLWRRYRIAAAARARG